MTGPRLRLSVRSAWGGGAVHPVLVDGSSARIGSSEACEVRLPHPDVAPVEARVVRDDEGRWWLEAADRRGRIRLNEHRPAPGGRLQLDEGDVIRIRYAPEQTGTLTAALTF